MLTKEKTLEIVQSLPDEFSLNELVERLILLSKIEFALQQVENGQVVSTAEARQMLSKWLS